MPKVSACKPLLSGICSVVELLDLAPAELESSSELGL